MTTTKIYNIRSKAKGSNNNANNVLRYVTPVSPAHRANLPLSLKRKLPTDLILAGENLVENIYLHRYPMSNLSPKQRAFIDRLILIDKTLNVPTEGTIISTDDWGNPYILILRRESLIWVQMNEPSYWETTDKVVTL